MAQELQRLMGQFKIGERSQARPLSTEGGKGSGKARSIKAQPKAPLIKTRTVDSSAATGGQGLRPGDNPYQNRPLVRSQQRCLSAIVVQGGMQ